MSTSAHSAGTLIAGRYRIIRKLGEGGFGAVYLAEDTRLDNACVALKESFQTTPGAQEQFKLEASLLARLHHSNLPRVTDIFLGETGRQFLVMDFIEGEDLDAYVMTNGPMDDTQAVHIISQVCEAVAFLHTRQPNAVIHRDIKPGNIKIRADGQAMLVDFGIAKLYEPSKHTKKAAKAFSPHFAPPEQMIGTTDTRTDVYSLGATLFAVLTGQLPPDSLDRLSNGETLPSLQRIKPNINVELDALVMQAMALNPDERFQSASHLLAALRDLDLMRPTHPGAGKPRPQATPQTRFCPRCGSGTRSTARFCTSCGTRLPNLSSSTSEAALNAVPVQVRFEMANQAANRGHIVQAIEEYQRCLNEGFSDSAVFHNLAYCYILTGQAGQAITTLRQGLSHYPKDADLNALLSRAHQMLDQHTEALHYAGKAYHLAPNDTQNALIFGQCLLRLRRTTEAVSVLEQAARRHATSPQIQTLLGRAYGESGNHMKAIQTLSMAAQLEPGSAEPHMWMGLFYLNSNQLDDAARSLSQAIAADRSRATAHYLLGEVFRRQNRMQDALRAFDEAIRLNPEDVDYLIAVAQVHAALNQTARARAALYSAQKIAPHNEQIRQLLRML